MFTTHRSLEKEEECGCNEHDSQKDPKICEEQGDDEDNDGSCSEGIRKVGCNPEPTSTELRGDRIIIIDIGGTHRRCRSGPDTKQLERLPRSEVRPIYHTPHDRHDVKTGDDKQIKDENITHDII